MTFHFASVPSRPDAGCAAGFPLVRRLIVVLGLVLAVATASAQSRPTTSNSSVRRPTTGATGGYGGGGFSGNGQNGVRNYTNSTMLGDALITSDVESRRLIVVTDEQTNESIKAIIADLDKPKPQVLISVVFVQVSHDNDLDLGAEATYTGTLGIKDAPTGTALTKFGINDALNDPTGYGAFYKLIGKHDINATLHALSTVAKTEILSRPSILTRSSQQATILVGQSVPIITNSRVSDTTNTTINTVQYEDVGIILRVTPFITQDGMVEMIVSPEISSLSATTVQISANVTSPVIDRRAADTVVVTPSDQTVVIGGLMSTQRENTDHKVPILGDIPLLGYAFKRHQTTDVKTELMIFLTPHVVQNPSDLTHLANSEKSKLDLAPKTFERGDLNRYLDEKPAPQNAETLKR